MSMRYQGPGGILDDFHVPDNVCGILSQQLWIFKKIGLAQKRHWVCVCTVGFFMHRCGNFPPKRTYFGRRVLGRWASFCDVLGIIGNISGSQLSITDPKSFPKCFLLDFQDN